MKEFMLCILLVATVIVTTVVAALSAQGRETRWFGTESQRRPVNLKISTLFTRDNGGIQRNIKNHFLDTVPDDSHLALSGKCRRKKREYVLPGRGKFGFHIKKRFIVNIRNGRIREAKMRSFIKQGGDDEFVRNFRHIFQQMLRKKNVSSPIEHKVIKKRDLGINREPDFVVMRLVDTRETPLGNRDSLVHEGYISLVNPNEIIKLKSSFEETTNKNIQITTHASDSTMEITNETPKHKIEVTTKSKEEEKTSLSPVASTDTTSEEAIAEEKVTERNSVTHIPDNTVEIKNETPKHKIEITTKSKEEITSLLPGASTDPTTEEAIAEKKATERKLVTLREDERNWGRALVQGTVAVKPQSLVLIPAPHKGVQRSTRSTHSEGGGGGVTGDEDPPVARPQWSTDGIRAKVRAAQSRLDVALCALGVVLVAVAVAAAPSARRALVAVELLGKRGRGSAHGGGGEQNEGALLVPHSSPPGGCEKEECAELFRVEGLEEVLPSSHFGTDVGDDTGSRACDETAATHVVHPRMTLSRLPAAFMASVRRLQIRGQERIREFGIRAGGFSPSRAASDSSVCV